MTLRAGARRRTLGVMALFEIKIEIPADYTNAAEDVLFELARENWSVLEDVIVRRTWLVGIGADETQAASEWSQVVPLMAAAGVTPMCKAELRSIGDAD